MKALLHFENILVYDNLRVDCLKVENGVSEPRVVRVKAGGTVHLKVMMASPAALSLNRTKSLPEVNGGAEWGGGEDDSGVSRSGGSGGTRDSGVVVVATDGPSFPSDARSSLLGDLPSGVAMSDLPSEEVPDDKQGGADDPNKKETIGRHYYPEGGWGWVVLTMALLVHVASHGLHQAAGILILHTLKQFPEGSFIAASKSC